MADVEWFGHSCFAVRGKTKTLVFDPFKGLDFPNNVRRLEGPTFTVTKAELPRGESSSCRDCVELES